METYLSIFFRTISIMLILLFFTVFVMGKKSIGELPVFDTLTIIVLGNVVGAVIVDGEIGHLPTIFAVIVLALFEKFVNKISLKFNGLRRNISFEPTIVVKDGKIIYQNVKRIGYSIDNILMFLRQKSIFDLSTIEFAIIEANGDMSVLKKPEYETVTLKDLQLTPEQTMPPISVIVDGEFQRDNIGIIKSSIEEIVKELTKQGYKNYKDVFYAAMDSKGTLHVSPYKYDNDTKNK